MHYEDSTDVPLLVLDAGAAGTVSKDVSLSVHVRTYNAKVVRTLYFA